MPIGGRRPSRRLNRHIMDSRLATRLDERIEVLDQVRHLLIDRLRIRKDPDEIDPDTPLFGGGLALDSIDAVDLMVHMQADFGVELQDDYYGRDLIRTVNCLVDLVLLERERRGSDDAPE